MILEPVTRYQAQRPASDMRTGRLLEMFEIVDSVLLRLKYGYDDLQSIIYVLRGRYHTNSIRLQGDHAYLAYRVELAATLSGLDQSSGDASDQRRFGELTNNGPYDAQTMEEVERLMARMATAANDEAGIDAGGSNMSLKLQRRAALRGRPGAPRRRRAVRPARARDDLRPIPEAAPLPEPVSRSATPPHMVRNSGAPM